MSSERIPEMTKAERDAINSPRDGLIISQTDGSSGDYIRRSGSWVKIPSFSRDDVTKSVYGHTNFNDKLPPKYSKSKSPPQTFASRDLGSWTETDQSRIIKKYKSTLEGAVSLLNRIKSLDRNQDSQNYFNENSRAIREHYEQSKKYDVKEYMNYTPFPGFGNQFSNQNRYVKTNDSGCYIATMAYGDYDHPQVIELRKYRDQVLLKNYFGKLFVKIYYTVSPHLVKKLKNQNKINKLITSLLDKLIEKIN